MSDARLPTRVETARLVLRTWQPADREPLAAMNGDPEVTRYLGGPITPAQSNRIVDHIERHWREHG